MKDLIGKQFVRLQVMANRAGYSSDGILLCECRCQCGNHTIVRRKDLLLGKTRSCGCLALEVRTKHGKSRSATWGAWKAMKQRCLNPNTKCYEHYGGRGIRVCERWIEDFRNFLRDMGECPDGLTLERKDVNGDYEPGNCCWDTQKAQLRNKRDTVFVVVNGERLPLVTAAERVGVDYNVAYERHKRGDSIERVFRV